jgi:hypothetical protein
VSVVLEDFQERTKICVNLKLPDKIQPWLQESRIFTNQLTKVGNSDQASARARRVNLKVDNSGHRRWRARQDEDRFNACGSMRRRLDVVPRRKPRHGCLHSKTSARFDGRSVARTAALIMCEIMMPWRPLVFCFSPLVWSGFLDACIRTNSLSSALFTGFESK